MSSSPQDPSLSSSTNPGEAHLIIRRDSEADVQQRQIIVVLDGAKKGELLFGEVIRLPLTAGHHRLRVDNTWKWKTVEFDARPGEAIEFRVESRAGRFSWFLFSAVGAGPMSISVERVWPSNPGPAQK